MLIVNTEKAVLKLKEDLNSNQDFITVDTEFIREVKQFPLLCLLQLATKRESYVIDPVCVDIKFLQSVFADEKIVKVFHDAKQDMIILEGNGFKINNFYDTQLYEMILSTKENISYRQIVMDYTNKKLSKNYGLSDWSKRPLSKKQLAYAAEDVTYLRMVYKEQMRKLKQLHRENWLTEEVKQLIDKNPLEESLNEDVFPVLYKLLNWREDRARKEKIALEEVASDKVIKSICKKGYKYVKDLQNSRNLTCEREFLDYAESIVDEFAPEKMRDARNPVVDLLKTLLTIKTQEHNVAAIMLASSKDLIKFASGDKSVKFLQGWRREIFGNSALKLLKGEIKLSVKDNRVCLNDE